MSHPKTGNIEVRYANQDDLEGIVDIINYYNAHSIGTFDDKQYTAKDKLQWFEQFEASSPYKLVVAIVDNKIAGYTSSKFYRDKVVFAKTIETGIYVHPDFVRHGLGSMLYGFLFKELEAHELHRALVGIALPNDASIRLHEKFNFKRIGTFDEYAFFKGRYISSVWMEKKLPENKHS